MGEVMSSFMGERLLTQKEVAELLQVDEGTLEKWRCNQRYDLPYSKIGRLVRYRYSDVLKFIEERMVS